MNKTEIETEILKYFYNCWERGARCTIHSIFRELINIDKNLIERIGDELEDKGFIKGLKSSPYGEITPFGIIEAEKREIISAERIQRNGEIRYKILELGFNMYETHHYDESVHINDIKNFNSNELNCNADFLKDRELIYFDSTNTFHIKPSGIKQFQIWQKQKYFQDEFRELSELNQMTPQQRGKRLETLIAEVSEFVGWEQEPNVQTSYEQIDVVINKNREYYLIECKWEKDPSEAEVIDKLFGKLSRRAGTNGILMSMSGFSKGSVECVKDFTNQKLILLFGKKDIEQIISNPDSFEKLFNEKYKELVMRRNVIWK